ncbi:hypothetical protein EWM64_g6209 [Hericium alpestre]|uniref:Uncharacterized protein n=1 Tax=Hericium alpestre TaxID=135208 RepID=A0A4Y9ZVA3_9AGAM|nr:hypothetical protein EWM64_g6209 [Hericium alpestre]
MRCDASGTSEWQSMQAGAMMHLPGKNLPDGWEKVPPHLRYLYTLLLAMDANFKAKLKNHGYKDIELAAGMGYFVPEPLYCKHLNLHKDEAEMKSCDSNFAAVDHANTPAQKQFAINGIGMVFSKKFPARMLKFLPEYRIDLKLTDVKFWVSKFHLPAHGTSFQVPYSFNFTEGVGHTCGEGIEANWSKSNGATLSTREMSHGAWHEALNDVFSTMNWHKTRSMGTQLLRLLKEAVTLLQKQEINFQEHKQTFSAEIIEEWDKMIQEWDADKNKPNPYEEPVVKTSLADVRLQLTQEEAVEASRGVVAPHETMATSFLIAGLEIQEQQCLLQHHKTSEDTDTVKQKTALQEKQNAL